MYSNLQEATIYAHDFLDNYFQEQDFLSKQEILMDLFEEMIEKIQDWQITEIAANELDANPNLTALGTDRILQEWVENYSEYIRNITADYVMSFVDIENSEITISA